MHNPHLLVKVRVLGTGAVPGLGGLRGAVAVMNSISLFLFSITAAETGLMMRPGGIVLLI